MPCSWVLSLFGYGLLAAARMDKANGSALDAEPSNKCGGVSDSIQTLNHCMTGTVAGASALHTAAAPQSPVYRRVRQLHQTILCFASGAARV